MVEKFKNNWAIIEVWNKSINSEENQVYVEANLCLFSVLIIQICFLAYWTGKVTCTSILHIV